MSRSTGRVARGLFRHAPREGDGRSSTGSLLALAAGELGEEVFVDPAEKIAGGADGNVGERAEELARERGVGADKGRN